jgi:hypothetical protein
VRYVAGIICVLAVYFAASPANADWNIPSTLEVVVIEKQEDGFLVHQFIESTYFLFYYNSDGFIPSLLPDPVSQGSYEILEAKNEPLLLFVNNYVQDLEDSIIDDVRDEEITQLEFEDDRQIIEGLFQIPFWPFIATSEVPMKGIDASRAQQIPHERGSQFPAMNYLSESSQSNIIIKNVTESTIYLDGVQGELEGNGLVLSYNLESDTNEFRYTPQITGSVIAIYTVGCTPEITSTDMVKVDFDKLMYEQNLEESDQHSTDLVFSIDQTIQNERVISRAVLINQRYHAKKDILLALRSTDPSESESVPQYPLWTKVAIFWLLYGISVILINLIFTFSTDPFYILFLKSIAIYPVMVVASLLFSGLMGLGFVPAALGLSRFLAPDGKRIRAAMSLIGSSFIISLIIFFTS